MVMYKHVDILEHVHAADVIWRKSFFLGLFFYVQKNPKGPNPQAPNTINQKPQPQKLKPRQQNQKPQPPNHHKWATILLKYKEKPWEKNIAI